MDLARLFGAIILIIGIVSIAELIRDVLSGGPEDEIRQKFGPDQEGSDPPSEGD